MRTRVLPPGPKGHFLLGALAEIRQDDLNFLARTVREYGDIFRVRVVNIPGYVLSHPRDIESVLISNQQNFIKSVYLTESKALFGEGLLTSDGPHWRQQRRLLQPSFHHEQMVDYTGAMLEHARRMLETWQDGEIRDIHQDMMALTMNIISEVLFGDDIALETDCVGEALRGFFDQFDERFGLYLIPEWLPTPGNLRYRRAIRRLDEMIGRLIQQRQAAAGRNGNILSALLRARSETGEGMTATAIRDQIKTLFFTGHETTGLALSWTWYLLAQNPRVESRLVAELDGVLNGRLPAYQDLPQLPYTEMVVKESLRLYPPAYAVVREAVEDCEIGGYTIPGGSTVAMFQWIVHRDPRYFNNPDEFIPERWENNFQKRLARCAYFPFGAGPRLCIGDSFAKTELPLLIAAVAQRYHFDLVPGHRVLLNPTLTLRPREGIKVVVRKRQGPGARCQELR